MTGRGDPAVLLDRDGTIIEDVGYPRDPEDVRLIDGAADGLARLRESGFRLVVASNQSGIGRGLITAAEARAVHERVVAERERHGVALDGARSCPHAPDAGCECRKPKPGLLLAAADELGLDLGASFMLGDRLSDVEAGRRAGCRTVLLATDPPAGAQADHVAARWFEALDFILRSGTPA
ncbi:MAG TPA: HAD family hydrolase [Solirubrobacteraceae bacterium]|nr:HAD family hydrolase [Solirubrobacteraceae bacterium]